MRIGGRAERRNETPNARLQASTWARTEQRGEAKRKSQVVETKVGSEEAIPARAVLTSSRNRRPEMTRGCTAWYDRPNSYLRHQGTTQNRANRTTHERERQSDETRDSGTDTTRQASKQTAPPRRQTANRPPPSVLDGWRETPEASKHGDKAGGKKSERRTDSTAATARFPAHRVARRGERRDGPMGKQDIAKHPHDEMRTPFPRSQSDRRADRGDTAEETA